MKRKKRKPPKKDTELFVNYYLVAFIDILGQKEALQKFAGLPDRENAAEMQEFVNLLKQTFGRVSNFNKSFEGFFASYTNTPPQIKNLTPDQKKIFRELKGNRIKFQRFTDGIVVFVSLSNETSKLPIQSVWGTLSACAAIFLLWLSLGHPLRGGVEIGLGAEMYQNEIYGPVVAEAYKLESQVAQYPRVVAGKTLQQYLLQHMAVDGNDIYSRATRSMAELCSDLLVYDEDGYLILDYLGETFRKNFTGDSNADLPHKAYQFLLSESQKWKQMNNTNLAFRYRLIRNYFEAMLPNWPDLQDESNTE